MAVTNTVTRSYNDGTRTFTQVEQPSGNSIPFYLSQLVPIAVNTEYHIAVTVANLQSVMLCNSGTNTITIYTNNPSGSSPQDTIALLAGQCYVWTLATDGTGFSDGGNKIPFSGNVTAIYVTNGGAAACQLDIRGLCTQ
jgi:hypothetical protein